MLKKFLSGYYISMIRVTIKKKLSSLQRSFKSINHVFTHILKIQGSYAQWILKAKKDKVKNFFLKTFYYFLDDSQAQISNQNEIIEQHLRNKQTFLPENFAEVNNVDYLINKD